MDRTTQGAPPQPDDSASPDPLFRVDARGRRIRDATAWRAKEEAEREPKREGGRRGARTTNAKRWGHERSPSSPPTASPHAANLDSVPDVETALVNALDGATKAGRWDVVAQLARELEARRLTRSANVVKLDTRARNS